MIGPNELLSVEKIQADDERTVTTVTWLIIQSFKSQHQVKYQPVQSTNKAMSKTRETPLSVGLGLLLHQNTCSKELIDTLDNMNLSISYEEFLSVKKDILVVCKRKYEKKLQGALPAQISQGQMTYYAIDNTDLKIGTADGKHQLHGTAMTVCQKKTDVDEHNSLLIELTFDRTHF